MRALLATLASIAVFATAQARPALEGGDRYVALGSSYAAGPGLGAVEDGAPARCGHGAASYARQLASKLRLNLVDASCSGSTTEHILARWSEIAPQIDAVTAETRLVTVTTGGNDVSFVTNLGAAACASMPLQARPAHCPQHRPIGEDAWRGVEMRMGRIADEVHRRAPQARLVFVDYVTLVGPAGGCADLPGDLSLNRTHARRLAAITARVARSHNALLLKASRLTAHHGPCDGAPWSLGVKPATTPDAGVPLHPGPKAHAAIADALAALLATPR